MRRAWAHDRDAGVLVGVGWVVVVALIAVLFQVELDASRRFVNVIAHGTGFTTGMMVTLGVIWGRRALRDRNQSPTDSGRWCYDEHAIRTLNTLPADWCV